MSALRLMGLGLALAAGSSPGFAPFAVPYHMPAISHRPAYSRGPSGVRRAKREATKRRNRLHARGKR